MTTVTLDQKLKDKAEQAALLIAQGALETFLHTKIPGAQSLDWMDFSFTGYDETKPRVDGRLQEVTIKVQTRHLMSAMIKAWLDKNRERIGEAAISQFLQEVQQLKAQHEAVLGELLAPSEGE